MSDKKSVSKVTGWYNGMVPAHMRKPMAYMLISVGILFGGIFIYKGINHAIMSFFFKKAQDPVITVSTATVTSTKWTSLINAVGSSRATLGVNVTAEQTGMITSVFFKPGAQVKKGTALLQQDAAPSLGKLHSLQAQEQLAKITYERNKKQYQVHGISKQQLDTDFQNWKNLQGQVEEQAALVAELTIKAPFDGKLGISNVYPGQFLNPGDPVVQLQHLDPIFVDFYLPQQQLGNVRVGHDVAVKVDAYPDKSFPGMITTVEPVVNMSTRNFKVEATLPNPNQELLPGMFGDVTVMRNVQEDYLTLPVSAVTFNPYGEIVYIVTEDEKDGRGKIVEQQFVTTGPTRGDQIAILKGLKVGDVVVSSGQLKLKNGSRIAINNKVQPSDNPNPTLANEHGQG